MISSTAIIRKVGNGWAEMPVSPARAAAFEILLRVERTDAYASELLHSSRYTKISPPDHALATELVMGVLRWRSRLDLEIAKFSSQQVRKLDAEVLIALRLAAYQILFLERIPARAAVHESVELVKQAHKRSAAPLVNAVLRKLSGKAAPPKAIDEILRAPTPAALARISAHPEWLVERWGREYEFDTTRLICSSNQAIPATTIRLRSADVEEELREAGIELARSGLLAPARRVVSGDVTRTRAFATGRISVQDEASQLVGELLGKGDLLLDCCAAPGGKTAIIAGRNPQARILALELHPHRARLLRKRVPNANVYVIAADATALPVSLRFDRVLVDVPCSGTGTLARHPEIKWRLRAEDLAHLQSRQLAILRSAMSLVAVGGRLLYSTCSLEREENSEVIEKALAGEPSFRLLDCRAELERLKEAGELLWSDLDSLLSGKFLRTIPGVAPGEGFFAALLEREPEST